MSERYDFILKLIKEAGEKVLESREKHVDISTKNNDPRDLVTNVDLEVNAFVINAIKEAFPGDEIYSEEVKGGIGEKSSYWSIDPIDGTSNFSRNVPHFAVVISYIENGEAIVGAIYNPVTREMFSFEKGRGVFLGDKPLHVSTRTSLSESFVLLHIGSHPSLWDWGLTLQKEFLARALKCSNLGSSALDLAFLAAGRVDAVVYGRMTTADIAVATALVREAGGEIYDIEGNPIELKDTPQKIIATASRSLFEEISKI